jgi:nucleoside-diphosphate-sugar epimerase
MTKRVLVTGATGFVGSVLCDAAVRSGYVIRAALRTEHRVPAAVSERVVVGDINAGTDWNQALRNVDLVLHVAARAHILGDEPCNAHLYTETNVHGTQRLAEAAARAGVQRLVFMSSVKVNGEDSGNGVYGPDDVPHPRDAYGESKALAEGSLRAVAAQTSMQTVCVRSPLVYGPGVRANFLRLLNWVYEEWPLPLGAVHNRRSLVSLWNLCDLLVHVLGHPAAANRTWMVSDGEDLSTPDLVRRMGSAMNRRVRLLPVPAGLLHLAGGVMRRKAEVARLCGSLAVDVTRTRDELGWSPPVSFDEGLARTVSWYIREGRSLCGLK